MLQWPDRGRASNTCTHPMPCQAAKPHKPTSRVWDLNSVRSILVNNTISSSSYVVMSEVAFEGFALGLEGWKKAFGGCCEPGKGSEVYEAIISERLPATPCALVPTFPKFAHRGGPSWVYCMYFSWPCLSRVLPTS